MRNKSGIILLLAAFTLSFVFTSCAIFKTIENMKRLKFKIGSVNNISLNGISFQGKLKLEDFNPLDAMKFIQAFSSKRMPLQCTVNIIVENPNNGTGGYPRTDLTLKAFPWKFYIDNRETVSGNIGKPIFVPGVGETTVFPIVVEIDLFQFFGTQGYKGIVDIALKLAGADKNPLEIKMTARPVIGTPLGDLSYPGELTIVSKEFR